MSTSLLVLLLACDPAAPLAPPAPPSLVLVTMDTTRADHIGVYGDTQAHTPTVDSLALGGVRFDRAYAVAPLTTPAHSSMLSGLYPARHGVHSNGDAILPEEVQTLAEVLHARGYRTAASVAAFVTTRAWNLDQGFEEYFDQVRGDADQPGNRWAQERPADEVVDDALAWLGQDDDRPFFLWAHFYDPHRPYRPPEAQAALAPGRPYDGEIAFMDAQIARLRGGVQAAAGEGGVAWVLVGDHGEALHNEHGESDHGMFLFQPTVHVPFIARPARPMDAPVVVRDLAVSNVDVMPTALGLLGLAPPAELDGVDLSGAARGESLSRPPVYLESYTVQQRFGYHPEIAVAEGPWKLIDTPSARLFDVASDPAEQVDRLAEHPEVVERLRALEAQVEGRTVQPAGNGVAPEMAAQLEALGYMAVRPVDTSARSEIDASDRLPTIRKLEHARVLGERAATAAGAVALYREIMAAEPQLVEARLGLARAQQLGGDLEGAEATLRAAVGMEPDSTVLRMNLANIYSLERRPEDALAQVQAILAQVPGDDAARVQSLRLLMALGRPQEALGRAREWLAQPSPTPALRAQVGLLEAAQGDWEAAVPLLQASLADDVPRPLVRTTLARAATRAGDPEAAEELLQAELADFPALHDARWALANLLMQDERWDDAAAEYAWLTHEDPTDWGARRAWAQAVFNAGDYPGARALLDPALEGTPDDPEVLLLDANLLAKEGHMEQARAVFSEAQALRQQSPSP